MRWCLTGPNCPKAMSWDSAQAWVWMRTTVCLCFTAADASGHSGGHDIHWAYEGEGGPQAWGKLKPEFETCATGKRQSPIHIESSNTLQGPAEPLALALNPCSWISTSKVPVGAEPALAGWLPL